MKIVGPLYQRQAPAQSGGVAVTVGTRVVMPSVRRRKKTVSQSFVHAAPAMTVTEAPDPLGTPMHVNAPAPSPIPTVKNAIGAPKMKPKTLDEVLDEVLGSGRETTVGIVVR